MSEEDKPGDMGENQMKAESTFGLSTTGYTQTTSTPALPSSVPSTSKTSGPQVNSNIS